MKRIIKLIAGIGALLLIFSCEEKAVMPPRAEASIDKEQLTVNETMVIRFTGVADQVVVYPGDNMHDYTLRDQSNTGLVVNKNLFTYSYSEPGVYKVVVLASTAGDMATDLKFDTCSFVVTVIDDVTEIDKLSCVGIGIYNSEIVARKTGYNPDGTVEWLLALPRRMQYNNQARPVSLTSQRLSFSIRSAVTKVFINGNSYSATTGYNLSAPLNILVRSDFGTEQQYKLYTINYPEFSSFKLAGIDGVVRLDEFNYNVYIMNVTLPSGTNVTNLAPVFTTYSSAEKVYIGDTEQISDVSTTDFTNGVTYRLVSTLSGNPDMQAISTIYVQITYQ